MVAMMAPRASSAKRLAVPLLIGAMFSLPAMAELSDTIHPFVAGAISYDDNLLRVDQNANPGVPLSDTYRSAIAGIELERAIGRQLLTGSVRLSKVNFNRFTEFDYLGKDATLDLDWKVAAHFSGHIGGSYSESLASFADFHSSARNLRTDKKVYANINWLFHPSWQVHGGRSKEEFHFELPAQAYNNRTEDVTEGGVDYIVKSGSSVGFVLRRLKGGYPDTAFGTATIDNGYVQDEAKLNVSWLVSGVTQVTFLGGRARRRHNIGSLRDESGNNGRLIANWSPRSQLTLTGMAWREFAVSEGALVNSALATGESVAARWQVDSKIVLTAKAQNEKREFRPLAGVPVVGGLSDETRSGSLGVTYRPLRPVTLALNAFTNRRSGSTAAFTNSYRSKGIAFNANVKF
jgi:exopolysaccharide biosynthesis operon protein EpsL